MTELSSLFNAYNDQGSELDIYYFESKKTMDVNYKVLPQMSDISWKDHSIAGFLPEPPSSMGKFTYERSDEVEVLLSGLTSQDFTDYCTRCKETGFVIDIEYDNDQYSAYNDDGYQVEVFFWPGRTTMEIRFSWPIQFGEIDWPNRGIGSLLPKPDSTLANVSYDSSNFYAVYVSMTPEEYRRYVQKCIDVGFKSDVYKSDKYYSADYDNDISIIVSYEGFNTTYIDISGSASKDYSNYKRK